MKFILEAPLEHAWNYPFHEILNKQTIKVFIELDRCAFYTYRNLSRLCLDTLIALSV